MQARSRKRVEAILDATERLVLEHGVEDLTTRDIARAADIPVASLYQYFADKEGALLALAERDMAEMDDQVAGDPAELERLDVATFVATTMRAFLSVYLRRPAFVEIYLRGRTNPALHQYGQQHNVWVARALREFAIDAGLARPELTEAAAGLAVEVGDRVFQLAFEHDRYGDAATIDEGVAMLTAPMSSPSSACRRRGRRRAAGADLRARPTPRPLRRPTRGGRGSPHACRYSTDAACVLDELPMLDSSQLLLGGTVRGRRSKAARPH